MTQWSDERTREYLLQLMRETPELLMEQVPELKDKTERVMEKGERLLRQLEELESVVHDLCDTATRAAAIRPLWEMLEGKGDGD